MKKKKYLSSSFRYSYFLQGCPGIVLIDFNVSKMSKKKSSFSNFEEIRRIEVATVLYIFYRSLQNVSHFTIVFVDILNF
jgi:hypothetical protein